MTQNTLNDEIKRIVDELPSDFSIYKGWEEKISQSLRSIAEKTVEAVRVEKKEELDVSIEDGDLEGIEIDGFNQAITEQTNLANRWLGKE